MIIGITTVCNIDFINNVSGKKIFDKPEANNEKEIPFPKFYNYVFKLVCS